MEDMLKRIIKTKRTTKVQVLQHEHAYTVWMSVDLVM